MTEKPKLEAEPRWHRRKEARPTEILDAALEEFSARGFAAARLEDIARRAGCTKGTIFLYFQNKEDLLKALTRHVVVPRIEQAEQIVEKHEGSMRELLEKLLRSRWETMTNSSVSRMPKLIFAEAGNFPDLARFYHQEVIARSHAIVERVLRTGIERGEFRDVDVTNVARAAVAPILMGAMWKHSFALHMPEVTDMQPFFETSLDLLLRGIVLTPSTGGDA